MNKHCYRIIFSQSRGQWVVVAETAKSHSGGSNNSVGSRYKRKRSKNTKHIKNSKNNTANTLKAALLCSPLSLFIYAAPLSAGIVVDHNAAKQHQASVLKVPNGVPLIQIQTPSAAGVSLNQYRQFDVDTRGVILNNSRTDTQTELGGWIQGNPSLSERTATVIVNEVNSHNPSLLNGYIEVGGDRAHVIVANPSGISCDGCGFINAQSSTLTTGKPLMRKGRLEGYRVEGGYIEIKGEGFNTLDADYTDLMAEAVEVNAGIWADNLKITTGNYLAKRNAKTGSTRVTDKLTKESKQSNYSLDVGRLGGMYARKITLEGTVDGVGMRNVGHLGAGPGGFIVTADGRIENTGKFISTGKISIVAEEDIENIGLIQASKHIQLSTEGDITNERTIRSQGNILLSAQGSDSRIRSTDQSVLAAGVKIDGNLSDQGNLIVKATKKVTAQGKNLAGDAQIIVADKIDLSGSNIKSQSFTASANTEELNLNKSVIKVDQALVLNTPKILDTDKATISAQRIKINAFDVSNRGGTISQLGNGNLSLELKGSLKNDKGSIISNSRNLYLKAEEITNTEGQIEHLGAGYLRINTQVFDGNSGIINSENQLKIYAETLNLNQAKTKARWIRINGSQFQHNKGTLIQTGNKTASINIETLIDNTEGTLKSHGGLRIYSDKLINDKGTINSFDSYQGTELNITEDVNNRQGDIYTAGYLKIHSTLFNNIEGTALAKKHIKLDNKNELLNTDGLIKGNQHVDITTGSFNNILGVVASSKDNLLIKARSGILNNNQGLIQASGNLELESFGLINHDANIIGASVKINTQKQALINTHGEIKA